MKASAVIFAILVVFVVGLFQATLSVVNSPQIVVAEQTSVVIGTTGSIAGTTAANIPTPDVTIDNSDTMIKIVEAAGTWLSPKVPYVWGGCSRQGVDCSCFVQLVYRQFGINVPRTTVAQIGFDRPINRNELQPGDTLFFNNTCQNCGANPTHEGLYVGAGFMIDAGDPVQIESINTAYWLSKYAGAGRPPGL